MNDLKKCPFCGSDAFMWCTKAGFKISCKEDCITMPPRVDIAFTSEEEAMKAWNQREELKNVGQ
jgi:hypothetical protein